MPILARILRERGLVNEEQLEQAIQHQVLYGGRHARVVARDSMVPAKKDRTIDVFDVEPAELRPGGSFRKDAGHSWAPLGMRRLLHEDAGQAALWASLAASGSKGSIADLYKEHKAALAEFRSALADLRAAHPRMAGVAAATGDSIALLELYGSPAIFGVHFERILESASLEAVLQAPRRPTDLPPGALSVRRLVEEGGRCGREDLMLLEARDFTDPVDRVREYVEVLRDAGANASPFDIFTGTSDATAPVTNPASGAVTGQVALASVADSRTVIEAAARVREREFREREMGERARGVAVRQRRIEAWLVDQTEGVPALLPVHVLARRRRLGGNDWLEIRVEQGIPQFTEFAANVGGAAPRRVRHAGAPGWTGCRS